MTGTAAELRLVRAELAALRADVAALRLRVEGKAYRDRLIRDLAAALSLGATWSAATSVALILGGIRAAPTGAEATVTALAGTRLSARQVLRILQAGAAAAAADKAATLCQSWPPRDDRHTTTKEP